MSVEACLREIKSRVGEFYVYVLSRPDGTPFYVGCGKARRRGDVRMLVHEAQAREHVHNRKLHTIRAIWRAGEQVQCAIHSWHATEQLMFAHEIALIAEIGRSDLKRGPLTNLTDGGDGLVNRAQLVLDKMSQSAKRNVTAEFRERSSKRIQASWDSPEGRAKRLAAAARSDVRALKSEANRRRWQDAGERAQQSERMAALWAKAGYCERQRSAHLAAVASDGYRALASARSKARWSDPAYRERLRESHRQRWTLRRLANPT